MGALSPWSGWYGLISAGNNERRVSYCDTIGSMVLVCVKPVVVDIEVEFPDEDDQQPPQSECVLRQLMKLSVKRSNRRSSLDR